MDEIHLWQWRYTDEMGKRRVSSWRMTEATVRQFAHVYRDAVKIEGSLESGSRWARRATGSASHVYPCGTLYESAWQLFMYGQFKGMEDRAAALALGAWARRNQIHLMFEVRRVREARRAVRALERLAAMTT